jgi:hypothetical protein
MQVATKADLQAMSRDDIDFSHTHRGLKSNEEQQGGTW